MYKVLVDFTDIATGVEYKAGDTFETEGVSENKIEFMSTPNAQREALIAKEGEEPETTDETETETTEETEPEATEGENEEDIGV